MSNLKLANNAISRLVAGISSAATSLSVNPGDGVKFPTLAAGEYFPATLIRASDAAVEIVKVTARASDAFTILRAQEGTAALTMAASDRIELRLTAGTFTDEVTRLDTSINSVSTAAAAAAAAAQATADAALPKAGGSITGTINTNSSVNEAKAADVASSATPDIWSGNGNTLHITGTITITGFANAPQAGATRRLIFDASTPLTTSSNLLITGVASGTTVGFAAGDVVDVVADTVSIFRLVTSKAFDNAQAPFGIRQTVASGPVDSNGFSSFGGSIGSATVTAAGTLTVTAANGALNRNGKITNPSWTGLSTNGTMYLGLTVNGDGTCTPFSTPLAPTYQWGGAFSTVSGQRSFNIQQMQMQVGNGSTAAQSYDVFVGETTVSGGVVASITWYALNGRYDSNLQATVPINTTFVLNHNLGIKPQILAPYLECITADAGYSVGDRLIGQWSTYDGANVDTRPFWTNAKSVGFVSASTQAVRIPNKSSGSIATATVANWKYGISLQRGW